MVLRAVEDGVYYLYFTELMVLSYTWSELHYILLIANIQQRSTHKDFLRADVATSLSVLEYFAGTSYSSSGRE